MRAGLYTMLETRVLGFVVNPKLMRFVQRIARAHIKLQVPDRTLRAKLTPNYTIGCKRVLISNDYYPSLTPPNLDVVTDEVSDIRGKAEITHDGNTRAVHDIIPVTRLNV